MRSHITIYVSAYCYVCVLILVDGLYGYHFLLRLPNITSVTLLSLLLLHMCPHTPICVFSGD